MKMILLLLSIPVLVMLTAILLKKKINRGRLSATILLVLYAAGVIKLIILFPILILCSLVIGTLILIMLVASPLRKKTTSRNPGAADEKIRLLHWPNDTRRNTGAVHAGNGWMLS